MGTVPEHKPKKEAYTRLDPVSHVLLRPGMYVGSVSRHKDKMWLLSDGSLNSDYSNAKMELREASYVPALYKIFDEILVNAADNLQRDRKMTSIDVVFDKAAGAITVTNDGKGIPVRMHETEKVYIPELVLGNLLTGSNFDDTQDRLTGGTHGFGAKLTNIFSTSFSVETADTSRKKLYRQTWTQNMRSRQEPDISQLSQDVTSDYTSVTFHPDFDRFGFGNPSTFWDAGVTRGVDDTLAVMRRRVWDVAGVNPSLKVTMDGRELPIDSFLSYVNMFSGLTGNSMYIRPNRNWEIVIGASLDGKFQQASFVNSLTTNRGGTHVNIIVDQITRRIADYINRSQKNVPNVTPGQVRNHMSVFVNALIQNPSFDSQLKESLTTNTSNFGSSPIISERFTRNLVHESGIVEAVVNWAQARERVEFLGKMKNSPRRASSRLLGIPKLEDANDAGHAEHGRDCTLILTEGDSAKALAVAGLAVIGRDKYGVFPLRGKPLNVRDAGLPQIGANEEIKNIVQILGLDYEKSYRTEEELSTLRYGSIMIMADQDYDGSHIKGLVLNTIHCLFPALMERNSFVKSFVTPIVKVKRKRRTQGSKNSKDGDPGEISFFSMPDYNKWRGSLKDSDISKWNVKYYKGLGTSTAAEARQYFRNLENHVIPYSWSGDADGERLDMAFRKSRAEDRKEWLTNAVAMTSADDNAIPSVQAGTSKPVTSLRVSDFVDQELVLFSQADNLRSIPSVIDGLKPSQRKVLHACLKRKLDRPGATEIKVAQLAGYVSEHTAYHHGEQSLQSTITNMAQDFVGSNNLPLLYPSGQFGTRLQGGKDAASPRYIFTKLMPIVRKLFPQEDDSLLSLCEDDGMIVEPVYYMPVIPLVLVNGSEGIGTGWSSSVPLYNPLDLISWIEERLSGNLEPSTVLYPWVRGFTGILEPTSKKNPTRFKSTGIVQQINSTTVEITELPVGRWTEDMKNVLARMAAQNVIKGYREHHTEDTVHFVISMTRNKLADMKNSAGGLEKAFKLEQYILTSNMHLFSPEGKIKKYANPQEILEEFFQTRFKYYEMRRIHQLAMLDNKFERVENKSRFLDLVSSGGLQLVGKTKADLENALTTHSFSLERDFKYRNDNKAEMEKVDDDDRQTRKGSYDYLLRTPLSAFTTENVELAKKEAMQISETRKRLEQTSVEALWLEDLRNLRTEILKMKGAPFEVA